MLQHTKFSRNPYYMEVGSIPLKKALKEAMKKKKTAEKTEKKSRKKKGE